jgi:acetyl esterase/lipase
MRHGADHAYCGTMTGRSRLRFRHHAVMRAPQRRPLGAIVSLVAFTVALLLLGIVQEAPAAAAPGDLLASTPVTAGALPAGIRAWRIWYRTTAFDDNREISVTGVVFTSAVGPARANQPIVVWAHGTTGIVTTCAPSLRPDAGAARTPGLQSFVQAGDVVVAPDYPGLGSQGTHPYLVGLSEGRAVLDAVRATRRLVPTAGHSFALWGISQGGHAALFGGLLASSYAPELDLRGVAVDAPAVQLANLLDLNLQRPIGKVRKRLLGTVLQTGPSFTMMEKTCHPS